MAIAARRRKAGSDAIFRNPPWRITRDLKTLTEREYDWWHKQFRAPEAWLRGRGKGVTVAVLDTGCDLKHPDLATQVDKHRDFTGSPFGATDINSHGTHCCGLVAAKEDDKGVMGIAPDCRLIVAKVLGDDGSGRDTWIAKGIEWAVKEGAMVLSMSLGSPSPAPLIIDALEWAIDQGVTPILAAGNEGDMGVGYPAKGCPGAIRVAASDRRGRVADFSSKGDEVDVAAPGVDMLSCLPNGKWGRMSGTSMATPVVAGAVALAISSHRGKLMPSPATLKKRVIDSADDAGSPGKDREYGWGLLRPDKLPESEQAGPAPGGAIDLFGLLRARIVTIDGEQGLFLTMPN